MTKNERNKLLIGIGCGIAAGFGTGYLVCKSVTKREQKRCDERHRRELKEAKRQAYIKGVEHGADSSDIVQKAYEEGDKDGYNRGMTEMNEFLGKYCVIPDENDTPETMQEKLRKKQEELAAMESEGNSEEKTKESAPIREQVEANIVPMYATDMIKIGMADYDANNHKVIFTGSAGTKIGYPANLFIGPDGEMRDSIDIRTNIRKHEHNRARLNLIWNQMGWGAYIPDLDDSPAEISSNDDIDHLDVIQDIDDDDRLYGDEPEEKTIEREKYLDEVNRYIAHPEEAPRIISRKEFDEEAYLDQVYFDYYDVDNKFIESTDVDNEIGPFDYFGVTNGNALFAAKAGIDDDDPDIVHVKNFKMNCVIEVTRYHRAYESIKDGGAYVGDGSTT